MSRWPKPLSAFALQGNRNGLYAGAQLERNRVVVAFYALSLKPAFWVMRWLLAPYLRFGDAGCEFEHGAVLAEIRARAGGVRR